MSPSVEWQTIAANALEAQASCIDDALAELQNAHAILAGRNRLDACAEIRAVAARLRAERDGLIDEARQRRAAIPQNGARPARKEKS